MKRVIHILTLALILLGLLVPAVSQAGSGDRCKILAYSAQEQGEKAVLQQKSVSSYVQIGWTLRSFLGTVFQALNWRVHGLYLHGPVVKADNRSTEPDRPLLVQRPDWWIRLEKSDRPDTDDWGWEDQR